MRPAAGGDAPRSPAAVGAHTSTPCGPALMRVFTEVEAYDEVRLAETSRVRR